MKTWKLSQLPNLKYILSETFISFAHIMRIVHHALKHLYFKDCIYSLSYSNFLLLLNYTFILSEISPRWNHNHKWVAPHTQPGVQFMHMLNWNRTCETWEGLHHCPKSSAILLSYHLPGYFISIVLLFC